MNFLIWLLCFWKALTVSAPPLISAFGDNFRSGGTTIISFYSYTYDFQLPYASNLPIDSISLALSLEDFKQTLYYSNQKISYDLLENYPTISNSTHANFRFRIESTSYTYRAKIKYLACPSSITSSNFKIVINNIYPSQTSYPGSFYSYALTTYVNTSGYFSSALWMSGITASRYSSSYDFFIQVFFAPNPSRIMIYINSLKPMYFGSVRVTLIFLNNAATTISATYQLPYFKYFFSSETFPFSLASFNSWFDSTKIICGFDLLQITSNALDYTYLQVGNSIYLQSTTLDYRNNYWSWNVCLVAGSKMCPVTHPYYDKETNLCYDSCPGQNIYDYLCSYACPSNCDVCLSHTNCINCSLGYYKRADNLCYSTCLGGTFPNSTTLTCSSCPLDCATCTSLSVCQTCSSSYFMRADHLCYSSCLNGFYPDSSTLTCAPCSLSCATCTSLTNCQTCLSSYFLRTDHLCYSSCLNGSYADNSTLTCKPCPFFCTTCISFTACQTCIPGYYAEVSNITCIACPLGCATCTSLSACQTCSSSYFLKDDHLCSSSCPNGFYPNSSTWRFSSCA